MSAFELAIELKLDADRTLRRVSDLAGQLADHAPAVKEQMMGEGLKHPIIPRLCRGRQKTRGSQSQDDPNGLTLPPQAQATENIHCTIPHDSTP
jgi:hypothetical protein